MKYIVLATCTISIILSMSPTNGGILGGIVKF